MATESQEPDARQLEVIGAVAAVGTLGAIAYVCYLLFEAPTFGVAVGATMGVGSHLHLPYVLQVEKGSAAGARTWLPDDLHAGATGLGLEVGGVVALAVAFVEGAGVTALAAGLGVGILLGIGLSTVLPEEPAD